MDRERKIHDVTFSWISFYKKKKKKYTYLFVFSNKKNGRFLTDLAKIRSSRWNERNKWWRKYLCSPFQVRWLERGRSWFQKAKRHERDNVSFFFHTCVKNTLRNRGNGWIVDRVPRQGDIKNLRQALSSFSTFVSNGNRWNWPNSTPCIGDSFCNVVARLISGAL